MSKVSLTPEQLAATLKRHSELIPTAMRAGAVVAAERGVTLLKRKSNSVTYTGHFKNAWRVTSANGKDTLIINDSPIAGVIERGARPHEVSAEGRASLREWIRKTMHITETVEIHPGWIGGVEKQGPRRLVTRRITSAQMQEGVAEQEIDKIMFAILQKLRTKGQPGHFIVRDNLESLGKFVVIEVVGQLKHLIDEDKEP